MSSKFKYYSISNEVLDQSRSSTFRGGILDYASILGKLSAASSTKYVDFVPAIILKTEKITLKQVSPSHHRFIDLLDPESLEIQSTESIVILRHYCAVDGRCAATNPCDVPPELLTIIYEPLVESDNEVNLNRKFAKINVEMLASSYGLLLDYVHPNAFVSTGGEDDVCGKTIDLHSSFGEVNPETLEKILADGGDESFPMPLDKKYTKTIQLNAVIHRMVGKINNQIRSAWSAGMGAQIRASGNNDPNIDGKLFKFFHMGDPIGDFSIGDRITKGDFLAATGRTGFMDPLGPDGKDSFPHLHMECFQGSERLDGVAVLKSHYSKVGGAPNDDWNRWAVTRLKSDGRPNRYSGFGQVRTGGQKHGGTDIEMPIGTRVTAPINGIITTKVTTEKYLKRAKFFRDTISAYNTQIADGGYRFSWISKWDGSKFTVNFEPDQLISFGANDLSFETHLNGVKNGYIRAERIPKGEF